MICSIEKTKVYGTVVCPANKSYTHRALFLASLADGKSIIKNVLKSRDTAATMEACQKFGAQIKEAGKNVTVKNSIESAISPSVIDAKNSGTTIRLAAAVAALSDAKFVLSGDESLKQRPMQPLLDALESLGARCSSSDGKPPITVAGKIKGGQVTIVGNISSQFISALMIVAPRTENGLVLSIKGDLVSKPYLDATISSMKKFGVRVETILPYKKYSVSPQKYKPTTFAVPSDFSSLALLLSASVLLGDSLTIETSLGDMPQGDEEIIDILEELGVVVTLSKNSITTKSPQRLDGGKFDLGNTPDLLAPVAILSLKTSKEIEILNVAHARYKETDRIAVICRELAKLGVKVQERQDGMKLVPPDGPPRGADLDSANDHRLFMAFCIAGMYVGNCKVTNPESIDVSYPNFITDMNRLGGKIKQIV